MFGDELFLHAREFALAAPGANTDILANAASPAKRITPHWGAGALRLTIALASDSVLKVSIKNSAGTEKKASLNSGTALTGGCLYTFAFACNSDCTYDFQVVTNVAVDYMQVDEVAAGVL